MPRTSAVALTAALVLGVVGGCADTPHYSPEVTTYYVSPDGDDSAPGTSADRAWRTLARADELLLHPGDRLLLQGGARFSGQVAIRPDEAGDPERPVVIGSYGKGRATVVATGAPAVSVHNTGGVDVSDLVLEGRGSARTDEAGVSLYYDDTRTRTRESHVTLADIDVSGFQTGIAIGSAITGAGFSDVTVRRASLHDNKDAGLLTYGPDFEPQRPLYAHQDITVEQVDAHSNSGDPEASERHTGNGIVLGGVHRAVVRDSSAHDNGGSAAVDAPGGPVGMWAYDSANVLMQHNTAYRNHTGSGKDGSGFGLDSNVSGSTVQYNLSYQNDGSGYYAYSQTANGAHTNNRIRYNISDDDGRKLPWHGALTVYGDNVSNLSIYQNTVTMSRSPGGDGTVVLLRPDINGISFRNNLLVSDRDPLITADAALSADRVVFQGNQYHSADGPWRVEWGESAYRTLDAWRADTGQERVGTKPAGTTADPCLAGGPLPDIRSAGSASLAVSGCPRTGLDLRALFGIDPGTEDFFGREVTAPPVIGAAQP